MIRIDRETRLRLRALADDIGDIARNVDNECRDQFRHVARDVAADARARAPYATGRLRDSIDAAMVGGDVAVVAGVPYAAILDKGGSHPLWGKGSVRQAPTHFLTYAVLQHEQDFVDAADRAIGTVAQRNGF